MSKDWKTENITIKVKDCCGLQVFPSDIDDSVGKKCRIYYLFSSGSLHTLFLYLKKGRWGLSERVDYFTIWQYFCIQKLCDKSEPFPLLCRSDTCAEPIGREWLLCLVCYPLLHGWGKSGSPVERALYQSVNFSEEQLTGCHSLVTSPEEKIGSYQESTQTILI